jgi:hypothetical protein
LIVASALGAEAIKLDLEQAIKMAFEQNRELNAKREEIGIAQGRVNKSNLFLQQNPELEDITTLVLLGVETGRRQQDEPSDQSFVGSRSHGGTYQAEGDKWRAQQAIAKLRYRRQPLHRS